MAYREALKERTLERVPLDWATSKTDLEMALALLAKQRTYNPK